MKNINNYILTAIVSLVLVVATSFLMTAADEPIRQAGYYLPVVFGIVAAWAAWSAGVGLRGAHRPPQCPRRRVRQSQTTISFLSPNSIHTKRTDTRNACQSFL